ncbi:MAG TPA: hypothetical protein VFZ81_02210 [Burkholderiales bacterium]
MPQAREGLRRLMDADVCVVAGLSLANRLDKGLVAHLRAKRDGRWLVVNHDAGEVREACEVLRARLARCEVSAVEEPFDAWVEAGAMSLPTSIVVNRRFGAGGAGLARWHRTVAAHAPAVAHQ